MKSKKLNFAIIGCGSVSLDHAKAIKKLGHKISYGSTKNINSKNWKLFKKKFPQTKFIRMFVTTKIVKAALIFNDIN